MTAKILPRDYGVKLTCNCCGISVQTAMCGKINNRAWFKKQGWGRGSDPGSKSKKNPRPSTKAHDLCPTCLKLDRDAAKARKEARAKQVAARDEARKARARGEAATAVAV